MIDGVRADELPPAPVLADAGYGNVTAFRDGLSERQIPYVVGIAGETTVWLPGMEPLPPKQRSRTGRPPSRIRRSSSRKPAAVLDLVIRATENLWKEVD
jgi:SRSO17 transposase